MLGSVALLINNVTAGSMVVLPQTFQQAGWVLPVMCLFGVAALSCVCGLLLIEAMTLVPGNNRFQKRMEYTNIAQFYFPPWLYWVAQIFYQLSIMAQNVSMIIQSVQVMDFTLVALTGYSCAIPQFSPGFAFTCNYPGGYTTDGVSPFGDWYLVSLGWLVTCAVVMPLGFIDLDDNDAVQKGGFFAVLTIVIVWCGLSLTQPYGLDNVTHFGGQYDSMMGAVLFNFAIVYTIPSWVNEKKPSVPIVKALAFSMCAAAAIFSCLGYCGGAGFPPPQNNQTLLNQIYSIGSKISAVTFFLFPACVNLTSIPVNSIMQRYNLKEAGVCGPKWAAFWGVVLPWLLAIPLYTGNGYQTLVTWSGLVLLSSVNFIFPPIIYLIAVRRYGTGPDAIRTLLEEAELTGLSSPGDKSLSRATTLFARSKTHASKGPSENHPGGVVRQKSGTSGAGAASGNRVAAIEMIPGAQTADAPDKPEPGKFIAFRSNSPGPSFETATTVAVAAPNERDILEPPSGRNADQQQSGKVSDPDAVVPANLGPSAPAAASSSAVSASPAAAEHKSHRSGTSSIIIVKRGRGASTEMSGGATGAADLSSLASPSAAGSAAAPSGDGKLFIQVQPESDRSKHRNIHSYPELSSEAAQANMDAMAASSAQAAAAASPAAQRGDADSSRNHPHHVRTLSNSVSRSSSGKPSPILSPINGVKSPLPPLSLKSAADGSSGRSDNPLDQPTFPSPAQLKQQPSQMIIVNRRASGTTAASSAEDVVTPLGGAGAGGKTLGSHPSHSGDKPPSVARIGTSDYAMPPPPPSYDAATTDKQQADAAAAAAGGGGSSSIAAAAATPLRSVRIHVKSAPTAGAESSSVASPSAAPVGDSTAVVAPINALGSAANLLAAASAAPADPTAPQFVDPEVDDVEPFSEEDLGEDGMMRLGLASQEQRAREREEARHQRTLKRLRKARLRKEALAANPDEVAKAAEVILPLDVFHAPSVFRWQLVWILTLPWHVLFFLTVPHSATTARLSRHWWLTTLMVCCWCTGMSFLIVWSSQVFCAVTGITSFAFGIFFVGFFIRWPNLLTEFRSFQNGAGDLNRIFSNSVWQICICLPLPWMCFILSTPSHTSPFIVFSGTQAILSLTLFLLSSLLLVMLASYDWFVLRPLAVAATAIFCLLFVMTFMLEYNVLLDLSNTYCDTIVANYL